jgi:23S rRNA pseudouridine1911/1915/1917 synthase
VPSFPFTAELVVERYLSGVRIDTFLARHFRNYTPWKLQRIVAAGQVKLDGNTVEIAERVYQGDTVTIRLIEPPDKVHRPQPLPVDIVYEDAWLIVVDKPPGQIVHPAGDLQTGTLCNALQHHFDQQTAWPGLLRPGIVHRLDRMTSGLIVVAKEHLAHRQLSIQFQQERISKSYLALVEGVLADDRGTIDVPIGTSPEAGSVLMSCSPEAGDRRPSRTDYEVLARGPENTLVRARPRTGRNHQIRLHMAEIGHPVVGDEFYGPYGAIKLSKAEYKALCARRADLHRAGQKLGQTLGPNGDSTDDVEADEPTGRHALHAHRLEFDHPILGGRVTFESPLPADISGLLRQFQVNESNDADVSQNSVSLEGSRPVRVGRSTAKVE